MKTFILLEFNIGMIIKNGLYQELKINLKPVQKQEQQQQKKQTNYITNNMITTTQTRHEKRKQAITKWNSLGKYLRVRRKV